MSEAKEGKLFGRKKLLDPLLGTTEGTKITSTIIFYTSHALTVYSTVHSARLSGLLKKHRQAKHQSSGLQIRLRDTLCQQSCLAASSRWPHG